MKKMILSGILALGAMVSMNDSYAQSNTESIARKALREAGCLGDNFGGTGSITFSTIELGTCESNGYILPYVEVSAYPNPNNNPNIAYKLGPIGKVTLCGTEVLSVECLP